MVITYGKMVCSYWASLLFIVGAGGLLTGVFLVKKTDTKKSALEWLVLLFLLIGCYHTLAAGVINLFRIPSTIITIGIGDMVPAVFFWRKIIKTKEHQQYEWKWPDTVFIVLLLAFLILFIKYHYGGTALIMNYQSIDAGVHCRIAMNIYNCEPVMSMYHDALWNALFMETLGAFSTVDQFYRWYVLADVIHLGMAAAVFYAIARRHGKGLYMQMAAIIMAFIYVVGYPMNSTLFGFSYLGMSVTLIGMLILIMEMYLADEVPKWYGIAAMMLGCLGLIETYAMFVPVVYFAVIFCIFRSQQAVKKLISKETVMICLAVFLIPCMLGLWYTYRGVFAGGITVGNAISHEGGCYRELYSNFLFFIPGAILGYVELIRRKKQALLVFLAPFQFAFTALMFVMTLLGRTSSYYYYKLYFPLWLVVILLNIYAAAWAVRETRLLLAAVVGVWCALALVFAGNIEHKIQDKNPNLILEARASHYVDVIGFNLAWFRMPEYSTERLELYSWVYQNLLEEEEGRVPAVLPYEDSYWFENVTNQQFLGWDYYRMDIEGLKQNINESGAEYVLVLRKAPLYYNNPGEFDSLERVYENAEGFVARWK